MVSAAVKRYPWILEQDITWVALYTVRKYSTEFPTKVKYLLKFKSKIHTFCFVLSGTVLLKVREKCLYPCVCVCEEPTPSCWYNRPVPWTEYHDPDPLNSHKYPPIISCYNTAGSFKLSINGWSKELQYTVVQSWSYGSAKLKLWQCKVGAMVALRSKGYEIAKSERRPFQVWKPG